MDIEKLKEKQTRFQAQIDKRFKKRELRNNKTELPSKSEQIGVVNPQAQSEIESERELFKKEKLNKQIGYEKKKEEFKPLLEAIGKQDQDIVRAVEELKTKRITLQEPKAIEPTPIIQEPQTPTVTIKDITMPTPAKRPRIEEMITPDIIGERGYYYLKHMINKDPDRTDPIYGFYWDYNAFSLKIGKLLAQIDTTKDIEHGYLVFPEKNWEIQLTDGLYRLLTYRNYIQPGYYTEKDLRNYITILHLTDAMYHHNDKSSLRPKASQGSKWKDLISHIWTHIKGCDFSILDKCIDDFIESFMPAKRGSGLVKLNKGKIEYKYIKNIKQLQDRLHLIAAEEEAGNNSFHNEKMSIIDFIIKSLKDQPQKYLDRVASHLPLTDSSIQSIKDVLEESIRYPIGIQYLLRTVGALPRESVGGNIFNKILDKLPEMHLIDYDKSKGFRKYNYCGPGTKVDKRLARGDKPINELDAECMKHDIVYNNYSKGLADENDIIEADEKLINYTEDKSGFNNTLVNHAFKLKKKLGLGLFSDY
ncbi:hypothetical protein TcasGA2_TC002158 [Tribolium castaneum]|uniref:Phospholipase A2-like domain-containing protein n=1 Tax=Tribolium castaneum TaxID=7070 RepID=D7ELY0_TRICA|nr:hypothetical protein TcasGA2_TC002158 [Tribolium castaneum]